MGCLPDQSQGPLQIQCGSGLVSENGDSLGFLLSLLQNQYFGGLLSHIYSSVKDQTLKMQFRKSSRKNTYLSKILQIFCDFFHGHFEVQVRNLLYKDRKPQTTSLEPRIQDLFNTDGTSPLAIIQHGQFPMEEVQDSEPGPSPGLLNVWYIACLLSSTHLWGLSQFR